jgi:hypothetical protein
LKRSEKTQKAENTGGRRSFFRPLGGPGVIHGDSPPPKPKVPEAPKLRLIPKWTTRKAKFIPCPWFLPMFRYTGETPAYGRL